MKLGELTFTGTVYPWYCDHMNHMNVRYYVGMFDEAVWYLLDSIGFNPNYMSKQKVYFAAIEQNICYKKELNPGELIKIFSHITNISEKTFTIFHTMVLSDLKTPVATMEITEVCIDLIQKKSRDIPYDLRTNLMKKKQDLEKNSSSL